MTSLRSIAVAALFAGIGAAQAPLNLSPSRILGHPRLANPLDSANENLVEGREVNGPQSIALDTSVDPPLLYVSDSVNNRILAWRLDPANPESLRNKNGAKADIVIGQRDFLNSFSNGPGPGSTNPSGLRFPGTILVDNRTGPGRGDLYVVDTYNNRILRFPKPAQQNEQLPDLVIGQTSVSCPTCRFANQGNPAPSEKTIAPSAGIFGRQLAWDAQGNLWFADTGNSRVLRYPASALGADAVNNPAADVVIGQFDFVSTARPPQSAIGQQVKSNLLSPTGLAFDSRGRLFVCDTLLSR
ncbi:MAG: hypothetical protein ACRD96_25075, partial [Bryobacteraceae bacterium]